MMREEFMDAPALLLLEDDEDVITMVVDDSNADSTNITIDTAAKETTQPYRKAYISFKD